MMKHFVIILVLTGVLFAADPNIIDQNAVAAKQVELVEAIDALKPARAELEKKVYSGTMQEILAQRVIDINDVKIKADEAQQKAVELAEIAGLDGAKAEYIKSTIEISRRKAIELKGLGSVYDPLNQYKPKLPIEPKVKMADPNYQSEIDVISTNAQIKSAIEEMKNSPGWLPDVNDPNYLEEVVRMGALEAAIEELCKDS